MRFCIKSSFEPWVKKFVFRGFVSKLNIFCLKHIFCLKFWLFVTPVQLLLCKNISYPAFCLQSSTNGLSVLPWSLLCSQPQCSLLKSLFFFSFWRATHSPAISTWSVFPEISSFAFFLRGLCDGRRFFASQQTFCSAFENDDMTYVSNLARV